MTTRKAPAAFEVPAHVLRQMLDLLTPHQGEELGLPILEGIHFETHGRRLYATATDRFTAGTCWHDLDTAPGKQSATIPRTVLPVLRHVLGRPRRPAGSSVTPVRVHLAARAGVDVSGVTRDGHQLQLTLPTVDGKYPQLRPLVTAALKLHADPESTPAAALPVNPSFLARFGALRSPTAFVVPGPAIKPVLIASPDECFAGVLMPRRYELATVDTDLAQLLTDLEASDG